MASYRFSVHQQPPALPGCCYICRSVMGGPFVDTKVNIPFEGVLYLCANCLTELYAEIRPNTENFTQQQVENVRNDVIRQTEVELMKLQAKVLDDINDARTRVDVGARSVFPDVLVFDPADSGDNQDSTASESENGGGANPNQLSLDDLNVEGSGDSGDQGSDELSGDSGDGTGVVEEHSERKRNEPDENTFEL